MAPVKKTPRQRNRTFFREWREHRGLKQYEAAERLEVEPSTLSRIESGESPYDQDMLERMALAYRCDPADLLAIDPQRYDSLQAIFSALKTAPVEAQRRAVTVLEALLKAS
jgi:transcriptional regulator with XRE-family HTH domain